MNEALLEKNQPVRQKTQQGKNTNQQQQVAAPAVGYKRVLVIGLGDKHHRIKNKLAADSHFEDSRRRALAYLRENLSKVSIVVALPHNIGGIGIEDEVWATGFTGRLVVATDGRNIRSNYVCKGTLSMVNDMPALVAKKLGK